METQREDRRQRYRDLKARGVCVMCGAAPATVGIYCDACRAKSHAAKARYQEAHPGADAARGRSNYWERRNAGLCGSCGKDVPVAGRTKCARCLADHRERSRRHGEHKKSAADAAALCAKCGSRPPRPRGPTGRRPKLCQECHDMESAGTPNFKARQAAERKERYRRLKEDGRCTVCEGPMTAGGPYAFACQACGLKQKAANLRSYAKRRADILKNAAESHLKWKYGLNRAAWRALLGAQGGRCGICGTRDPAGKWHVDHNHATDEVRGILCSRCNTGLGMFRDDPTTLQRAARYLVIKGGKTKERQAPLVGAEEGA